MRKQKTHIQDERIFPSFLEGLEEDLTSKGNYTHELFAAFKEVSESKLGDDIWNQLYLNDNFNEQETRYLALYTQNHKLWSEAVFYWRSLDKKSDLTIRDLENWILCSEHCGSEDLLSLQERLLDRVPSNATLRKQLAVRASHDKRWTDAAKHWQVLVKEQPLNENYITQWANACENSDSNEAIQAWIALVEINPHDQKTLNNISRFYQKKENWLDAEKYLRQLCHLSPDNWEYNLQRAKISERLSPFLANQAWSHILTLAPQDLTALRKCAHYAKSSKDHERETDLYHQILTIAPNEPNALRHLARVHHKAKEWDEAFEYWDKLIATKQADGTEFKNRARCALKIQHEKTQKCWADVLKLLPNDQEALKQLATLYEQNEQWSKAAQLWKKCCDLDENKAQYWIKQARASAHLSERKALKVLQKTIKLFPKNTDAVRALAQSYEQNEKWLDAAKTWQQLYELSKNEGTLKNLTRCARHASDKDAISIWSKILTHTPNHKQALHKLAKIHTQNENWRDAARIWKIIYQQDPKNKIALFKWARLLIKVDINKARNAWQEILLQEPNNIEALNTLVKIHTSLKNWEDVALLWRKIAQLSPQSPTPLIRHVKILEKFASSDKIETTWKEVLNLFPEQVQALKALGQIMSKKQDWAEALSYWQCLAKQEPDNITAWVQIARIYLMLEKLDDAENTFRIVLQKDPQHEEAHQKLIRLFLESNKIPEAIGLAQDWCARSPEKVSPKIALARSLKKIDKTHKNLKPIYSDILKIEPLNSEALKGIAYLEMKELNFPIALTYMEKACSINPLDAQAWVNRFQILDKTNSLETSMHLLDQVDTFFSEGLENQCNKARIYEVARQFDKAENTYKQACENYPLESIAHENLGNYLFRNGEISRALAPYKIAYNLAPLSSSLEGKINRIKQDLRLASLNASDYENGLPNIQHIRSPEFLYPIVCQHSKQIPRHKLDPSTPLNIVLVTGALNVGGAERQFTLMAKEMKKATDKFCRVTVLVRSLYHTPYSSFFLSHLEDAGIETIEYGEHLDLPLLDFSSKKDKDVVQLLSHFPDNQNKRLIHLYSLLRDIQPDIVHAWQDVTAIDAATAASLAGVPNTLLSTRSTRPDHHHRLKPYLRPAYQEFLMLNWINITNNSQAGLCDYADWLDLDIKNNLITYNGIEIDKLLDKRDIHKTKALRDKFNIPQNAPVIGGIMRLSEKKRPLLWLEAMVKVAFQNTQTHFVLLGYGLMQDEIEKTIRHHKLEHRIHLVGADNNVSPWYDMMSILVLTSRIEGCPNVIIEAHGFSVPVVSVDIGGVSETMEDTQTGWLIDNKSENLADQIAERVIYSLNHPEWMEKASSLGPDFINNRFSLNIALEKTYEALTFDNKQPVKTENR